MGQSQKMRFLITTLFFTISNSYPTFYSYPTIRPWWFAATTTQETITQPTTESLDSEHKVKNTNSIDLTIQDLGFGHPSIGFGWNRLWDSWLTNVFDVQPSFGVVQSDFAVTENYSDDDYLKSINEVHTVIEEISDGISDGMADEILKSVGKDMIDTIVLDYDYSGEAKFAEYVGKLEQLVEDGVRYKSGLDMKIDYEETEPIEAVNENTPFIENDGFNVYAVTVQ